MVTCGNAGGIISGQIYPSADAPGYRKGHIINLGFLTVGIILNFIGYFILRRDEREIQAADELKRNQDLTHTELDVGEMGYEGEKRV
ncbi:hypothetical protein HKX48_007053 [Thoreauomyces humboldtii]|nr:hypothetical protein HKX48_007053 [Thoreauomyces humboldtii]